MKQRLTPLLVSIILEIPTCFQLIWTCTEVVLAPPAIYLLTLKEILRKEIKIAAQNCYVKASGAFTGEIR